MRVSPATRRFACAILPTAWASRNLEQAGYLTRTRVGRRNRYLIDRERKVRTAGFAVMTVAQLLGVLLEALDQQPFS